MGPRSSTDSANQAEEGRRIVDHRQINRQFHDRGQTEQPGGSVEHRELCPGRLECRPPLQRRGTGVGPVERASWLCCID